MDRMAMIRAAQTKLQEEKEFKKTVKRVYSRPKYKAPKLTAAVKKAGHQSPGSLECFKQENMYYSDKNTQEFIAGSEMMHAYNDQKQDWD
jgi:hypothetical protein